MVRHFMCILQCIGGVKFNMQSKFVPHLCAWAMYHVSRVPVHAFYNSVCAPELIHHGPCNVHETTVITFQLTGGSSWTSSQL